MNFLSRIAAVCLLVTTFSPCAWAADVSDVPDGKDIKGATDHPLIQRFKGSDIRFEDKKAFSDLVISLSNARIDNPKTRTVEGVSTTLVYLMPKDVSTLEAIRGYQEELAKLGTVQVLFQGVNSGARQELDNFIDDFMKMTYGQESAGSKWMSWNKEYRYAALEIKRPEGDMFVTVYAGFNARTSGGDYYTIPADRVAVRLDIIEPKPRVARMVTVTSAEMSAELAKNGRVSLYGILFDTAKADIKPESKAALVEIAKLMTDDPKLRLMVVGHTDTQGLFEPNRDLSTRRAKAVALALATQYGSDPKRLQSFGASFAAPVASNASEVGRAKNRRVELVAF